MMKKILQCIDNNLLFGLSLFLLIFIPLYPKWPLFDILPGYNVRVRLEDFLVLFTFFIWGIYVVRKKIDLKSIPLFKPIIFYLVVGFVSTISAIFITKTVTTETYQIFKLYLHFFRRIEYFSLFFIFYSAIYAKEQVKVYVTILITAVLGVIVYGFGQKYLYWPAYSTMNREFSKGITLYLTEHARVLSTFGGHYDLAAYVMLTITILITLIFIVRKRWLALVLGFIVLAEFWLLILTASRTSFIAYIAAITATFFLLAFKKGWLWAGTRYALIITVSMSIMLTLGPMSERFGQVIKIQQIKDTLNKSLRPPPTNGIALRDDMSPEDQLALVASESDVPPTPIKPDGNTTKPEDVYVEPPVKVATKAGDKIATSTAVTRSYSDNALKFGLSSGIRLDALWPRAIAAFKQNPLLGTGYSTLVKTRVWEQTTAESTDSDYLRLLGETGLLGFLTFMSIFIVSGTVLFRAFKKTDDPFYFGLFASGIGLIIGLLFNALYIDVFEASKVAYAFWSLMGILLAVALITLKENKKD